MKKKKIAIIGAGISGLAIAEHLLPYNFEIDVFEKNNAVGGLCRTFEFEKETIERYYHYYLPYDEDLIDYTNHNNIKIEWDKIKLGYYINSKLFDYNSIFDIINFLEVSFINRLRNIIGTAIIITLVKLKLFKFVSATYMLNLLIGKKNYNIFWKDLIQKKFHNYSNSLTLNWLAFRMIRVSAKQSIFSKGYLYGYFNNQLNDIIIPIKEKVENNHKIILNSKIEKISTNNNSDKFIIDNNEYDYVISTLPLNVTAELIFDLNRSFSNKLSTVKYLDLITPVIILKKKFSNYFWLNTVDKDFIYPGIIEFTNLNKNMWKDKKYSLLYFPFYLTQDMKVEENNYYIDKAVEMLSKINKNFDKNDVVKTFCFKDYNTQAISNKEYYDQKIDFITPIKNFYIADSALFHPNDRSISECIKFSRKIAYKIIKDNDFI